MSAPTARVGSRASALALALARAATATLGADLQQNEHSLRATMNQDMLPYQQMSRVDDAWFRSVGFYGELNQPIGERARAIVHYGGDHFGSAPGGNDWVFRLLRAPAFARLPTGNIEKMFQMFEPVTVKPSEIVMREGDPADYFYVVRSGTASVSKYLDGAPQVVAYLREGDTFGEDALLSNLPRNATVRMMQGGQLMRLSREAFEAVLKPPMLSWVLPAEAARLVQGGAALLDVRMPEEHAQRAIDGSINVPLFRLREATDGNASSRYNP